MTGWEEGTRHMEEPGKGAGQWRGVERDNLRAGAAPHPIPQHTRELQNILAETGTQVRVAPKRGR